ncbi:hypothetical protein BDE02_03G041500 [Populus trichocarpa]|nr:hypothetical protein BDE02_03G041500 [Populus trichocarpa]
MIYFIVDFDIYVGFLTHVLLDSKHEKHSRIDERKQIREHSWAKGSIAVFNQLFGKAGGFQRQLQTPL